MSWGWGDFGDYVSVDEKRRRADALVAKLEKKGRQLSPVRLMGRSIASTFWGKAWCRNLESYGTYASRLPRGRSYVRNGAVVDLQIQRGSLTALVNGTSLYEIKIKVEPLEKGAWQKLKSECAGKVGSLIDLLRGKLSGAVMEVITRKDGGLFPKPAEIRLDCSCPDYADLCKHLAAVLYGVGARLDQSPELLFTLRGVDHLELFSESTQNLASDLAAPNEAATLSESDLADVFGIELEPVPPPETPGGKPGSARKVTARKGSQPARPRGQRASVHTKKTAAGKSGLKTPKATWKKPSTKQSAVTMKSAKNQAATTERVSKTPRSTQKSASAARGSDLPKGKNMGKVMSPRRKNSPRAR